MIPSLRLELQQERLCDCGALLPEGETYCEDCLLEIERDSKDQRPELDNNCWRFA